MILGLKKLKGKGKGAGGQFGHKDSATVSQFVSWSNKQSEREIDGAETPVSVFALPSVIHSNQSLHVKKGRPAVRF